MNLLDDTTIQPSKFRKRNWVEINEDKKLIMPIMILNLKLQ